LIWQWSNTIPLSSEAIMDKKPKPETAKTKPINIMLPEELLERVNAFCAERDMNIQDFVTDAIIEKLNLVYKERRTKVRL